MRQFLILILLIVFLLIICALPNSGTDTNFLKPHGLPYDRSVYGFPLTDGYWAKRSFGIHLAWDIAIPVGSPVFSIIEGKLTMMADKEIGLWMIVENTDWRVGYYHLSKPLVLEGDVRRGDLIALSGNSGNESHGAHLHYFIEHFDGKRWVRVNPNDYVKGEK
jgi:murein DD-endopeptidase MepM/ murein hydrolase activator NlpD